MFNIEVFYIDGSQSRFTNVKSFTFDSSFLCFDLNKIRTCDVHEVIVLSFEHPFCRCFNK